MKDLHCLRCKTADKIPAHNASNTTAADCSAAVFLLHDIWYLIDQIFVKGLPWLAPVLCTTWIFNIARHNVWIIFNHSYAMTSFQISKSVTKSSQITGCNLSGDVISFTQDK